MSKFLENAKKQAQENVKSNIDDFMTLIRVYYQSVIAINMGITNINSLPELLAFKRALKIATLNNKLGHAEKSVARKMLADIYGLSNNFFSECDSSIKKSCKNQNEIQSYIFAFQGFSNDLIMAISSLMKWKFRIPAIFKSYIRSSTKKAVHEILTKEDWKAADIRKTSEDIKRYNKKLGHTEQWMTEYAFTIIMLAKRGKVK